MIEGMMFFGELFDWLMYWGSWVFVYFWLSVDGFSELELERLILFDEDFCDKSLKIVVVSLDIKWELVWEFFFKWDVSFFCFYEEFVGWDYLFVVKFGVDEFLLGIFVDLEGCVVLFIMWFDGVWEFLSNMFWDGNFL